METREIQETIQLLLNDNKLISAKQYFMQVKDQFFANSTLATLDLLFAIDEMETQNNETSFFAGRTSIRDLEDCYTMLKFYLRRFDFNIPFDHSSFVNFVVSNHISASAIMMIIKTSMIHRIDVLNRAAMALSEHDILSLAVPLLQCAYQNSKDDTTLFNFALVAWKCGNFQDAEILLNQISTTDDDVLLLKKLVFEKVRYNEQ